MSLLTASIVLYNNSIPELEKVIDSYKNSSIKGDLIIVDNSPSNSLRKFCLQKEVEYIFNPSNPGFGAAHNIAIKKSIERGTKYHLVLNPDVHFNSTTLEKIVEFMDLNTSVGNLMPKVFYPDGSLQYLCKLLPTPYDWIGRRFNPFKNMVNKRNIIFELQFTGYNKTMEVPYLSGCFMFLKVDALKKIGLYDESIFMYGEETDLCRRLITGGFKTIFYPEASIVHEFQKGSHKSFRLTWIGIKSAIYYFNKWGWIFDAERKKINKETLLNLNIY